MDINKLMEEKRLFLGLSIEAPWNNSFPNGRILKIEDRHLTLIFFGKCDYSTIENHLGRMPLPSFLVTPVGILDKFLFLPKKTQKKVVAYHATFFDKELENYQQTLFDWCIENRLIDSNQNSSCENRFLPHLTIARNPNSIEDWNNSFLPHPFYIKDLCLYESLGNCTYEVLWNKKFLLPIEELPHTADIAYIIRAKDLQDLYIHAQIALCFSDENFLPFIDLKTKIENLDHLVMELNHIVAIVDIEIGSAFKAVSFHGNIKEENKILIWEMVIDV